MNRYQALRTAARFALILASVVVVQGVLAYRIQVFGFFDLPLIYCIYYGFILANPVGSIAMGCSLGLMQDSLSGVALGTNGFSKTLIGFLSSVAGSKFDVNQTLTRALALVLFTFLDFVLKVFLSGLGQGDAQAYGVSAAVWILSAGFNVLFGLVLFGYRSRFSNATA